MIDKNTKIIFDSFRRGRSIIYEVENNQSDNLDAPKASNSSHFNLPEDNDGYQAIEGDLNDLLPNAAALVKYITVTKTNDYGKIELSGTIRGNMEFLLKYGDENGIFITCDNFQMDEDMGEALRKLCIYFSGEFSNKCTALLHPKGVKAYE